LPIKDLTFDIDSFEERATQSNSSNCRGNSKNSNTHREGLVEELDIKQKIMLKLFSDLTKDFSTIALKIDCPQRSGYLDFAQETWVPFPTMEYYFLISFYFTVSILD